MLSLSFITGTEPDKWFRRFTDRTDHGGLRTVASDDALAQLLSGDVDVALVRLPDARVTDEMHVVRLYDEQPGIALPVDHTLTLLEQVGETDIVGELIHYQGSSDIPAIREHLGVVAAGGGGESGRGRASRPGRRPISWAGCRPRARTAAAGAPSVRAMAQDLHAHSYTLHLHCVHDCG